MMKGKLRGIHVFWMISAFFAVIIAVDVAFIVGAVRTFPGEDVKNSYVQGVDFNRTLAQRAAQDRLGWRAQAGLDTSKSHVVVRLMTGDDAPLTGLEVVANIRMMGRPDAEQALTLTEGADGEYAAAVAGLTAGKIDIKVKARRPGEADYDFEAEKSLVVS